MNLLTNDFVGKFTIAAGIVAVIQIILLALMFAVATEPYGPMSDVAYAITPLLMLPMIFAFRQIYPTSANLWALILGILGAIIATGNQVIFLLHVINLKQSILGFAFGLGLIGVAILLFSLKLQTDPAVSGGFTIFSFVMGAALAIGLILGTFFLDDIYGMASGAMGFSAMKPITYLILMSSAVNQLGLPVWLLLLGRMFLKGTFHLDG